MDISGKQLLGNNGSLPVSITFLSISQRLKESFGASIAETQVFDFLPSISYHSYANNSKHSDLKYYNRLILYLPWNDRAPDSTVLAWQPKNICKSQCLGGDEVKWWVVAHILLHLSEFQDPRVPC